MAFSAAIAPEFGAASSSVAASRASVSQPARASLRPSRQTFGSLRSRSIQPQRHFRSRTWTVRDSAQPSTVSEEDPEAKPEEELPTPEAAKEEAKEQDVAASKGILELVKDAYSSGDDRAITEAEAQLNAIEADRTGLADALQSMDGELAKAKDRFLRLNADFDNFRKRSEKEKLALANNVRGEVVEALLPMVDSFERAKSSLKLETDAEKKIDNSYQGIYKQFVEVMKSFGVAAVETVGKEFDPQFHEAIMREESTEFSDGVVVQEFRKGFILGERLLRPAMVKVSSGPGPEEGASEEGVISSEE